MVHDSDFSRKEKRPEISHFLTYNRSIFCIGKMEMEGFEPFATGKNGLTTRFFVSLILMIFTVIFTQSKIRRFNIIVT